MRLSFPKFDILIVLLAASSLLLIGCDQKQEAKGPEMGSIEQYLAENPEEALDDPDEAQDEGDEFDASGN